MKTFAATIALVLLMSLVSLGVVAARQDQAITPPAYLSIADLTDSTGTVLGYGLVFQDDEGSTGIAVVTRGLSPGAHGVHIHEVGNCDPAGEKTFQQAGAHLNPEHSMHPTHAGDLGNLIADDDGEAVFTIFKRDLALGGTGATLDDADGSALVVHADVDDLATDPSGNSGARIACAVLFGPR